LRLLQLVAAPGVLVLGVAGFAFGGPMSTVHGNPTSADIVGHSNICPSVAPTPTPNPIWAGKVPIQSGKVDYPFPFTPGVIEIKHSPGCNLDALLRQHGLGLATHNISPPFTDFDRAAGFDRSYRVQVTPGTEIATVLRLAPHADEFPFVGLFWIAPVTLD
jgi:hypothetical protein